MTKDLLAYLGEKLVDDGYSGLCSEECGCEVGDLMPCGCSPIGCSPGYKHDCVHCPRSTAYDCPTEGGGTGMCVSPTKDWPAPDSERGAS